MFLELLKLVAWATQAIGIAGIAEALTLRIAKPCLAGSNAQPIFLGCLALSIVLYVVCSRVDKPQPMSEVFWAYLRWSILFVVVGIALAFFVLSSSAHTVKLPC